MKSSRVFTINKNSYSQYYDKTQNLLTSFFLIINPCTTHTFVTPGKANRKQQQIIHINIRKNSVHLSVQYKGPVRIYHLYLQIA